MNDEINYYKHLVKMMLTTRGVRFYVSENEKRKERFSIITIAILTIYLSGWSIATAVFPESFNTHQNKIIDFTSIIASVALLCLSLLDYALSRGVFAEKMLHSAFQITSILREMERLLEAKNPDCNKLSELAAKYEDCLSATGINHNADDYKSWSAERDKVLAKRAINDTQAADNIQKATKCSKFCNFTANVFRIVCKNTSSAWLQILIIFFVIISTAAIIKSGNP